MINEVFNEDCLKGMDRIPPGSVDMILCDLPYGTTACKWDTVIPFAPLWKHYERIIKPNGAIVLTGSQPFTSLLICSNLKLFRYEWIWDKRLVSGVGNAKRIPMKCHENVLVFYKSQPVYNFQKRQVMTRFGKLNSTQSVTGGLKKYKEDTANRGVGYPITIIEFARPTNLSGGVLHPTQKPVALFEYLIKTYTNEGETVLDNCIGSGTTAIACMNTKRNYIAFEKDPPIFKTAIERIEKHRQTLAGKLF